MNFQKQGEEVFESSDILDRKWIDVNIPCRAACPIMTDIPGYIQAIMQGDYETANRINRMDNVLPGVLGRVCNRPCEPVCRHGRDGLGDPVSICFLKRSAADYGIKPLVPEVIPREEKVCVIGAGPAGLTAANDLALKGYRVTVLEQFEQPGGMLRYGIPQFRLPLDVVAADAASISDLGVDIRAGVRIEDWGGIDGLKGQYDAVVLAGGCMLPKKIDIPGLENRGVYWGIDFMMAANRAQLQDAALDKVVVIGGGFTAVDCTRMSYRLGAGSVTLAYRRTRDDMYVGGHELEAMEAEGIRLSFLVSPTGIESGDGQVTGVRFIRNAILEDRSLEPIEDSEFVMPADAVIFAIGQEAEDDILENNSPGQEGNFFIAGDFRNGASTVIEAAADGRKVAREVHKCLAGLAGYRDVVHISPVRETGRIRDYDFIPRQAMDETPLYERKIKNKEVELGFSREKSLVEARRCYLCFYNFQVDIDRCIYCLACIDVMPVDCIKMAKEIEIDADGNLRYIPASGWHEVQAIAIDNDKCIRCGNCVRACPVDCISISKYSLEVVEEK